MNELAELLEGRSVAVAYKSSADKNHLTNPYLVVSLEFCIWLQKEENFDRVIALLNGTGREDI